ncbi:MAG: binding protein [Bacteroidetes bacterium]|jgi:predicted 3-demethylubiquinone-9 3-methyltransferase (glyoxalase superfamily)|nr:binding protein [Bacteroidota bacterium]MDF2451783.1 binding protein [Bacteroidota bacterium]
MNSQKMSICLWFDKKAEEAAQFYTSVFKNSEMGAISRYGKEGFEIHHMPEGTVMTAIFKLNGLDFMALNGGPLFKFNESVSIVVNCETQDEIDHYWNELTSDGGQESQCGWLKDKYGVSWQIVPNILGSLMKDPQKSQKVMHAFMQMKKFDIEALKKAAQ